MHHPSCQLFPVLSVAVLQCFSSTVSLPGSTFTLTWSSIDSTSDTHICIEKNELICLASGFLLRNLSDCKIIIHSKNFISQSSKNERAEMLGKNKQVIMQQKSKIESIKPENLIVILKIKY